jgi:hypothetical protein
MSFCFHFMCVLLLQSVSNIRGEARDHYFAYTHQMSIPNFKLSTDSLRLGSKINTLSDTLKHPRKKIDSLVRSLNNSIIGGDTLNKSMQKIIAAKVAVAGTPNSSKNKTQQINTAAHEKVDSLINVSQDKFNEVRKRIEENKQKIQRKINVQDSLSSFQTAIPELQLIDVEKIDIPSQEIEMPGMQVPSKIPTIPETEKISIDIPKMEAPSIKGQVNGLHQKSQDVTDKFKTIEEYKNNVTETNIDSIATKDKLAQQAEKHVENLTEIKDVKEGTGKLTSKQAEYEAMMQRYRDKKLVEEEIKRKIKNVANDKVSQLTPAVQDAQKSLLKGKKIQQETSTLKAMLFSKSNAMAGKPLRERLVPGVMLQLYSKSIYSVDVAPQLGYRVSGRITSGIAGVYRFAFNKNYSSYVRSMHVYGGRIYTDALLKKGFFFRVEGEWLQTLNMIHSSREESDANVWSGHYGVGKQYNITRQLKGNILLLYRTEFSGHLPEQSKFNLRVGLNLSTKKRLKLSTKEYYRF